MQESLFREERLLQIIEIIQRDKKVVVSELSEKFNRSKASIRLDLAELEMRGLVERTHGGAILKLIPSSHYVTGKSFLEIRKEDFKEEKQRIGHAVANIVQDGDIIMIDGGSTSFYVVKHLKERIGLTIITSSAYLLPALKEIPDAKIYLTGGFLHRGFEDLIGELSLKAIQNFKPNNVIIGIDAISIENGLTATEASTAQIKRQMLSLGSRSTVVADSSKFKKDSPFHVADLMDIDNVVTDTNVPDDIREYLSKTDVNLVTV